MEDRVTVPLKLGVGFVSSHSSSLLNGTGVVSLRKGFGSDGSL